MGDPRDAETTPMPVELDSKLREQVEWFMYRIFQNVNKKVGETVSFVCGHAITYSVLDALPGSILSWFLNDLPLVMDPSRVLYNKGNIDITDLTPGDTGVYTCLVEWGPKRARENITVGVYSLQVTTDSPMRYVYELDSMRLDCHSVPLGRLFPLAVRHWMFNSTNVTSLLPTLASNISLDVVFSVTKSMVGVWECKVHDPNSTRTWDTAWYSIKVDDAPSFIERAYQYMLDHIAVVFIFSTIALLISCGCFVYAVREMKKKEDETDTEFLGTRNGWEETFTNSGVNGKVKIEDEKFPKKEGGEEDKNVNKKEGQTDNVVEKDVNKEDEDEIYEVIQVASERKESQKTDDYGGYNDSYEDDENSEVNKSTSHLQEKIRGGNIRRQRVHFGWDKHDIENVKYSEKFIKEIQGGRSSSDRSETEVKLKGSERYRRDTGRKSKKGVVYPEVSKDSAFHWLINNSSHLGMIDSILLEADNKQIPSMVKKMSHETLLSSSLQISDKMTTQLPSTADNEDRDYFHELYPSLNIELKGESSSNDVTVYKHTKSRSSDQSFIKHGFPRSSKKNVVKRMPSLNRDNNYQSTDHTSQVSPVNVLDVIPTILKSWFDKGRERLNQWTSKRSTRSDRRDVQYTVLPQDDEIDRVEL